MNIFETFYDREQKWEKEHKKWEKDHPRSARIAEENKWKLW